MGSVTEVFNQGFHRKEESWGEMAGSNAELAHYPALGNGLNRVPD